MLGTYGEGLNIVVGVEVKGPMLRADYKLFLPVSRVHCESSGHWIMLEKRHYVIFN